MIQCKYFGLSVTLPEPEAIQVVLNYLDDYGLERPSLVRCLEQFCKHTGGVQVLPIVPVFGIRIKV